MAPPQAISRELQCLAKLPSAPRGWKRGRSCLSTPQDGRDVPPRQMRGSRDSAVHPGRVPPAQPARVGLGRHCPHTRRELPWRPTHVSRGRQASDQGQTPRQTGLEQEQGAAPMTGGQWRCPRQGLHRFQTGWGGKAGSLARSAPQPRLSVLLVPPLPPGVDELPEEELAAQGAPRVLGVAAAAGEAVDVHHVAVGQGVHLHQEAERPASLVR